MSRRLRNLFVAATTMFLVTATVWFWLLHTAHGSRFIWSLVEQRLPGELSIAAMEGDLSGGLHMRTVRFHNDDVQVLVANTRIAVDFDLVPLSIEFTVLDIQEVDVHLQGQRNDDEPQAIDIAAMLLAMRTPIPFLAPDFRLTDLKLAFPDEDPLALISSLRMGWQLHDSLQVDGIELTTPFADLQSKLLLGLQPPFVVDLQADVIIRNTGIEDLTSLELTVIAAGDADRINISLSSIAPELKVNGTIAHLVDKPVLDLHALLPQLTWPVQDDATGLYATNVEVSAIGSVEQYELGATAVFALPGLGEMLVNVAGRGSPDFFRIEQASARGDRLDVSATGQLDWSTGFGLAADIVAERFDPQGFLDGWPRAHPLRGDISVSWHKNDIDISRFELFVLDTLVNVTGNGQVDTSANIVSGALAWSGIQWPLDAEVPVIASDTGDITVKGRPSNWSVDGALTLQAGSMPEGRLTINGKGDLDGIAVTIEDSEVLGGTVRGHGNYSWRNDQPFNANLQVDQVQTDLLSSDWSGVLSGVAGIDGTANPFAIDVDIAGLHGTVREQAFAASGALSIARGTVGFRHLDLAHGDSIVALDGELHSEAGVAYRFNVTDISDFTDAVSGSMAGSGKVSLNKRRPRFRGNLSATNLVIGDVEIESLQIEDRSAGDAEFINHSIVASGLRVNSHSIERLSVDAMGDADRHEMQAELRSAGVVASITATGELRNWRQWATTGELKDWQQWATTGWQGELEDLQIALPQDLALALHSPASLAVSASEVRLEEACVDIQNQKALCLRTHWIRATSIDLDAEMTGVPLSAAMLLVDTELDFTQELSGRLSWSSMGSKSIEANANIEISPGSIASTIDTRFAVNTGKGTIEFRVDDGTLGSGAIDLPFPEYGAIDIDFEVSEIERGTDSPLSGSALIDMNDISILAELVPFIDSDGGRLATDLVFDGTLSSPSIEGVITLQDASLQYLPLGTALSDLQIEVNFLDNNRIDLQGRFNAGEGAGTVVTTGAYEAGTIPDLEFGIKGSDLLLVDHPDLRVTGDPDISISISGRSLRLDGKIRIPEAELTPSVVPGIPISESDDVTIVAGNAPDRGRTPADDRNFGINGTLEVELGDDVNVDLGVATASIDGKVVFEWKDEIMPNATGAFSINGTMTALGQALKIREGTVGFPNVPASEPHLNIKAEREIYGNTQVKTAGILLTGTPKNPVVEPFTYPLTTEERALTLLATGSDFDYEQGVGALDFGMYIAPRFYLSYGIGLFERDSVISARYDLKKGFGVRVSSGARESGVDLSYRMDR